MSRRPDRRGEHTFTLSAREEGACDLCLLGPLAHAGTEDNCDECGYPVPWGDECGPCLDEDESLVHDKCCPEAEVRPT